jgi:hypothetical protein
MKNEPGHVIRMGLLKCEIARRETAKGVFFNVKLVRLFRNGAEWKESHLLGRDDLLQGAKLLDLAHTWIFAHSQLESRNSEQANARPTESQSA